MGGFGSGKRWTKKRTVESCYGIDVATLKCWGELVPGVTERAGCFQWTRGLFDSTTASVVYVLTVGETRGTLRLAYRYGFAKEDVSHTVRLVTTRCHLGGVRWWLVCPLSWFGVACGRRVRKLYLGGKYFGCRHCYRLTYRSRQESDKRVYALVRKGVYAVGDPGSMSLPELGQSLKALEIIRKRLNRLRVS